MVKKESSDTRDRELIATLGLKSGIGKSTLSRLTADLFSTTNVTWRGVSIDRNERVPDRYPGHFVKVQLPSEHESRHDPFAQTRCFEHLDTEIERLANGSGKLLLDVGSGEYPDALLAHVARTRMGPLLDRANIGISIFILTTADASVMADAPRLAAAVSDVLPKARIYLALNEKNGRFKFPENSDAHEAWTKNIGPMLKKHSSITIPGLLSGIWDPYENRGLRFAEVALLDPAGSVSDEKKLLSWTQERRSISIARQGDVAEWLYKCWRQLDSAIKCSDSSKNPA